MSKIIFEVAKSCVTCANINYVKKGLKIHRVVGCDLHNEELGDEYIYKVCPDWEKGSSVIYEKLPVLENDHNLTKNQKIIECDFFGCVWNLDEACSDSKISVSKNSKGELFCKRFSHANLKEQEEDR